VVWLALSYVLLSLCKCVVTGNSIALFSHILFFLPRRSKVSIKMSKTSDRGKEVSEPEEPEDSTSEEEEEEEEEVEEDEDEAEQNETPDLYRNSALGM
jgi:Ran GTPase-activating protein (RanGAP) involved in mRNA processing and transport